MISNTTRRAFIKTTGAALLATAALPAAFGASKRSPWLVGCRDIYLKTTGLKDPWEAMKALDADSIEVMVEPTMDCPSLPAAKAYNLESPAALKELKSGMRASKRKIAAFMMANQLDERFDEEMAWTRKVVKAADALGVPTIRIDVVPRKIAQADFLPFAVKACRQMCDIARGSKVKFAIENHGTTTNDPEFLVKLFDGVGSPKLGLTLDIANFYWWGHPVEALYPIYEKFGPRVFHTHCKNIRYPEDQRNAKRPMGWEYSKYAAPIYEGDIDLKRVVSILRKAGYKGDFCVEDESLGKLSQEKQAEVIRKEIGYLRGLV